MASTTPRQRQHRAALDAQQHNLQLGQFSLLLQPEVMLPPGQPYTALPLVARAGRWAAVLATVAPNLVTGTLLPATPVVGVVLDLPVRRPVWRAALFNDTDTTANPTTLLNEGVNRPPDGKALLPDPVRMRQVTRGLVDPLNLLTSTLAPVAPLAGVVLDLPVRRPVWPSVALAPVAPDLLTTLLNESVNRPPDGKALLPDPVRRPPRRGQTDIPISLLPLTVIPPAPTVIDLWAGIREGDIVRLVLPHASLAGRTVLARVLARQLADGSPHMELEVQVIEQVDAQTMMRAFGDVGAAGMPPVVIPTDARVTQGYPVVRAQVEALQRRLALQRLKYP